MYTILTGYLISHYIYWYFFFKRMKSVEEDEEIGYVVTDEVFCYEIRILIIYL